MRLSRDLRILLILAAAKILLHTLTNNQYGFHRDELATLDDARHLAWGYVAYPPVTPFVGRFALELFGTSLRGFRLFAAVATATSAFVGGLIALELGGKRMAQLVTAVLVAISPVGLSAGHLFQYVAFDYLAWVLLAYTVIRLLNSDDPRWWMSIGAVIGFGMLTKYTMIILVAGIVVGVLAASIRRHLRSRWLWAGVGLSLLIFLPNLIWQIQHEFISVHFLASIHARDIRIGRTDNFLVEQLFAGAGFLTVPVALAGFIWLFSSRGKRYRLLGWMFVVPLVLFYLAKGRPYYQAPAYPMLFAAGAVWMEGTISIFRPGRAALAWGLVWAALIVIAVTGIVFSLPLAPVQSRLWKTANRFTEFREEVGWPELVRTVADIRNSMPAADRASLAILTGNYGEAGAINLYGAAYGLPHAISGVNSFWFRGYGDPPPSTLIVVGLSKEFLQGSPAREAAFQSCAVAGHITNAYGVMNEETREHADIFVCRNLRKPWPVFWKDFRGFG
jgi:4-amino-4-deoxy-L-arabinose transferase-like glycosyltransferase